MRKLLKQDYAAGNEDKFFIAKYSKAGYRHTGGKLTPTICLYAITDEEGNAIADHMWFNYSSNFRKLGELQYGDIVTFKAKTTKYLKGHGQNAAKHDFKLTPPKQISVEKQGPYIPLPESKDLMIGYVLIKNHIKLRHPKKNYVGQYTEWARKKYKELIENY